MEGMEKLESDFFIQLLAVKTQWGAFTQADYGYRTVTFPISFSAAYAALNACRKDDHAIDWRGILSLTNTSMRVGFEQGAYWIAVGK